MGGWKEQIAAWVGLWVEDEWVMVCAPMEETSMGGWVDAHGWEMGDGSWWIYE